MFRLSTKNPTFLRSCLEAIASLISEGTFRVSKEGMKLIAMDPATVAMVIFELAPEAFDEFACMKESELTVSMSQLVDVMKRGRARDELAIELEENRLKLTFRGALKRSFYIPLLTAAEAPPKEIQLDYDANAEVDANALAEAIRDARLVSESLVFEASSNGLTIEARSELREANIELAKGSKALFDLDVKKEAKARYSIDYLERMLKAAKAADSVIVRFSDEKPLRLDFRSLGKFKLSFILAPMAE